MNSSLLAFDIPAALLRWYDQHRRALPWRALPGEIADPYKVWLSEIMLQQTVAAAVAPYFQKFVARWPTVEALAAAPLDDVLTAWAGLGYYARARNLHKCARDVVARFGGCFPSSPAELLTLPGIGAYTAGAIAAIAFDRPFAAADGNVERVVSRLARVETPLPAAKPELRRLAETLVPQKRAGDFAQAMMDLGATVCIPATPKCPICPLQFACAAFTAGNPQDYPRRLMKKDKPVRRGRLYWAIDATGAVLVRRRAETGLLGGMMEFPSSDWADVLTEKPPFAAYWINAPGGIRHTFTHFHLDMAFAWTRLATTGATDLGVWITPDRFGDIALPSLMRKAAKYMIAETAGLPLVSANE